MSWEEKWKLFFQRPIYEREIGRLTELIILLEKQNISNLSEHLPWTLHLSGISLTVSSSIICTQVWKASKESDLSSKILLFLSFQISLTNSSKPRPHKILCFPLRYQPLRTSKSQSSITSGRHTQQPNTLWRRAHHHEAEGNLKKRCSIVSCRFKHTEQTEGEVYTLISFLCSPCWVFKLLCAARLHRTASFFFGTLNFCITVIIGDLHFLVVSCSFLVAHPFESDFLPTPSMLVTLYMFLDDATGISNFILFLSL